MLKGNLLIWSKYRWNIEKWVFVNLISLIDLNEEGEKFISRWSQNLINVRSPSYLEPKTFEFCL